MQTAYLTADQQEQVIQEAMNEGAEAGYQLSRNLTRQGGSDPIQGAREILFNLIGDRVYALSRYGIRKAFIREFTLDLDD